MNQSRISGYNFKDYGNDLFKIQLSNEPIPSKFFESLRLNENGQNVRLINDWMVSISQISMIIWKYSNPQKNIISTCKEYFFPNTEQLYSCNQAMIMYNNSHHKPQSCIIVGDDAVVRFWPEICSPSEFIDQTIPGIGTNDHCLLVEKIDENTLVFIFKSMKIIIADIQDYTNSGILFKQFSQSMGIINGIGRCLSSFFVSSYNSTYGFVNVKVNISTEHTDLLLLMENNIDLLSIDLLYNGTFSKSILNHRELKNSVDEIVQKMWSKNIDNLNMVLVNFDFSHHIIYVILEISDPAEDKSKCHFLVTYNRNMKMVDSSALIKTDFQGPVQLSVIDDYNHNSDQPCLLVAVKDDHKIIIVEVLTGLIKAKFDAFECKNASNASTVQQSIIGWTCPSLTYDHDLIISAITANQQIVFIRQKLNPFLNPTKNRLITETNLSNASFYDSNSNVFNQNPDESCLFSVARSTPKSKVDKMCDRFPINNVSFGNKDPFATLMSSIDPSEKTDQQTVFDEFKKCVMGYWLGYKSLTNRLFVSIIESSQIDPEISIPILTLQIAREIIDELPIKDPRWSKLRNQKTSNEFCYGNKSLILSQQLSSKSESLDQLISLLKENNFSLFGSMSNVPPMSVYKCLFLQGSRSSEVQLFGDCDVTWNIVNCVGMAKELVEFIRIINELMHGNQCPEINTIIGRSFPEIINLNLKLTPLEVLSQKISMVPIFISDCCNFLNEKREDFASVANFGGNVSEQMTIVRGVCQFIGRIISTCLRASLAQRVRFEAVFHGLNTSKSVSAPCWITEPKPFGISESIIDIIVNLVDFSRHFELNNSQLFDLASDIVTTYLDCYQHRIKWMETYGNNEPELQRLSQSFRESRHVLIEKLVDDGRNIEKILELADRYQDFYWITTFCDVLDDQAMTIGHGNKPLSLDRYLRQYCDEGFSEYVLDWYQRKLKEGGHASHGQLLAKIQLILEKIQKLEGTNLSQKPSENNNMCSGTGNVVIGKFLERSEIQATRWLHEIETEDYGQAAKSLLRLGEQETVSVKRKKNLLSLAKLNCLVAATQDDMSRQELDDLLYRTRAHLKLIQFQEEIPSAIIQSSLGYSSDTYEPSIEVPKLVKLLLTCASANNNGDVKEIVQAFQLLQFSASRNEIVNLSHDEYNDLLSTIWCQSVLLSSWDDDLESTTLYMVVKLGLKSGLPLTRMMPDIDSLFENEMLKDISQNPEAVYSIKRAFETLNSEIQLNCQSTESDDESETMMVY